MILADWIREDGARWLALQVAAQLNLPDWCLAAGFIRNLVWDKLHNYATVTPLQDIDLIYFDSDNVDEDRDWELERELIKKFDLPWSVKNQARMHLRNGHEPYASTQDAMQYWPEIETAVGVRFKPNRQLEFVAPFGLEALMSNTITYNPNSNYQSFLKRLEKKAWLRIWPKLFINYR